MLVKDIDKINGAIDRPTKLTKELRNMYDTSSLDVFGLQEKGSHRKYGHDIIGLAQAMALDPKNGANVYMSHMMLDMLSNQIRNQFGTDNRDIAEVFFNRTLKSINNMNKEREKRVSPYLKSIRKRYENHFVPQFEKKMKRNKFYRFSKKK